MQRLKLPLLFASGLVIGAILAAVAVSGHWQRNFEDWYVLGMADQANVAREIASGRAEELATAIRSSLPGYVLTLEREFASPESSHYALWTVRDAYEAAGEPIPENIKPLLEDLTPRELCVRPASRL